VRARADLRELALDRWWARSWSREEVLSPDTLSRAASATVEGARLAPTGPRSVLNRERAYSETDVMSGRATQNSNLRPSASEAKTI
jgi:hypothetical protein